MSSLGSCFTLVGFFFSFALTYALELNVCGPGNSLNVSIQHGGVPSKPNFLSSTNTYFFKFTALSGVNSIQFSDDTQTTVLVVAGGGGGAVREGGGGGAGGLIYTTYKFKGTKPFTVIVGAGGSGKSGPPQSGTDGHPSSITDAGGGFVFLAQGGSAGTYNTVPDQGGSCGAQGEGLVIASPLNTNVIGYINGSVAGNAGGLASNLGAIGCHIGGHIQGTCYAGGGGGGSGSAGYAARAYINATQQPAAGGNGGQGTAINITGQTLVYAAGGGGGCLAGAVPGLGGGATINGVFVMVGGNGSAGFSNAMNGSANTGSGGGGSGIGNTLNSNGFSGNGADGVVIIAWQNCSVCLSGSYQIIGAAKLSCQICNAGTFSSGASASFCNTCEAGTYASGEGKVRKK